MHLKMSFFVFLEYFFFQFLQFVVALAAQRHTVMRLLMVKWYCTSVRSLGIKKSNVEKNSKVEKRMELIR